MLKVVYDRFDVVRHRGVDNATFVVSVDDEAVVLGATSVRCNLMRVDYGIRLSVRCNLMRFDYGIRWRPTALSPKFFDDEIQLDWLRSVVPDAIGVPDGNVAVLGEDETRVLSRAICVR